MEEKKQSKFPPELIELYNLHIHGEIDRREFLERAKQFAVGGITATALWEMLKPNYALGQQVPESDKRLKTETVSVPSPQGNGTIKGYLVRPASATGKLPGILVVHENRGLNPHIKDIARRLGVANFMALAPDGLTSVGGYPGDDEAGGQLFGKVDRNKMTEDFVAAANWLKSRPDCTGKIGVTGFCFGGGIANTLAVRMPDLAAAVPFYGGAPAAADVPKIKAAVLGVYSSDPNDFANNRRDELDQALTSAGVTHKFNVYPGTMHAFHNDTGPAYNQEQALSAWRDMIAWFKQYLA